MHDRYIKDHINKIPKCLSQYSKGLPYFVISKLYDNNLIAVCVNCLCTFLYMYIWFIFGLICNPDLLTLPPCLLLTGERPLVLGVVTNGQETHPQVLVVFCQSGHIHDYQYTIYILHASKYLFSLVVIIRYFIFSFYHNMYL